MKEENKLSKIICDKVIEDCLNNRMKVGNKYESNIGVKSIEVEYCRKSVIGENIKIIEKTFKNLRNGWFDEWEFSEKDIFYLSRSDKKKYGKTYHYMSVDFGKCLIIENDKFGEIWLSEFNNDKVDDGYGGYKVVVKSIKRYKDGVKGKMGSVLTILNRVCKGNDILIEIELGEIQQSRLLNDGDIKYDENQLEKWYNKRGFKINNNKSIDGVSKVMDSRIILEEYVKRMGWDKE